MKSKKALSLPMAKDLKSNSLRDIQAHLKVLYDELDRAFKQTSQDLGTLEPGTAAGQLLFWDGFKWIHTEITELYWNDTLKRFGIINSSPTSESDVTGTKTMSRLLAGGIHEG